MGALILTWSLSEMVGDPKKLTRGLKDISPLFAEIPAIEPEHDPLEIQVLGVTSPDYDGDSLFLNAFFASQIISPKRACTLLSILSRQDEVFCSDANGAPESFGNHLRRYCLYWDELRDLMAAPSHAGKVMQSRDIFLDFEYRHLLHCEQAVSLLDKWVFLLEPTAESLTEGYKMMKAGLALNRQLEFCIALSGKTDTSKGNVIFEQFSDFAFKNLNIRLEWLGWIDLEDPAKHFSSALHTELLRAQSWNIRPSLQKFMLAEKIESWERNSQLAVSAAVPQ